MHWFLIALIPPALWSLTNHADKYLINKFFKGGGIGALMVFSSIIGVFVLIFIAIIHPEVLRHPPQKAVLILLNGFIYVLAILPYYYALKRDETSIAVPMFQLIPIIGYFLAWAILGETLSRNQIIGGLIIIFGAIVISLDLSIQKKVGFKKDVFFLMLLSSLLFALNFLLFKFFALSATFWTTGFWEYIGFAIFAIILLVFIKSYRKEFFSVLKTNKFAVLTINGVNEIINIIAKLSFNFISLLAPITLIWIVNGFQPVFVFLYGVILTLFFPRISQEKISGRYLAQKLIAIVIMLIGAGILNIK